MKITEVDIEIEGSTPYLMNKMAIIDSKGKQRKGSAVEGNPDEWRYKTYYNEDGFVSLPTNCLIKAMSKAGAEFQLKGKKTYKGVIASTIRFSYEDDITLLPIEIPPKYQFITEKDIENNPEQFLFVTPVRQKASMIVRYRTQIIKGWKVKAKMQILDDSFNTNTFYECLVHAGQFCGLGDWRPNSPNPGSYGIFKVNKFEEVK